MVRTRFQRPTRALRLGRDVRVEFERARAGRVEEAARQTSVPVERVGRARFVARRAADVLFRDLFAARRADEGDAKERGLLGRIQHVAAREDVILRQRRDLATVLISKTGPPELAYIDTLANSKIRLDSVKRMTQI